MIKSLRKRFILFNVLVISCIVILIALFIYFGPNSKLPAYRYITSLSLAIFMVFIGSWILSKAAIRPIQAAWQKQLDFTADASHELRTPISVIQTNLELVMDNHAETVESQMKWLKNIEAENKRMAKLVEDLLTLSRADTNQPMLEMKTFSLDNILLEVIVSFTPIANSKNIMLEIKSGKNISFYGDSKRMRQLFTILLDNALHYTDSGTITISIIDNKEGLQIIFADTGIGIEPENLDKIFNRFYRIPNTRKMNQEGSGLGLAIAKWIVEAHKGTIKAASTLGTGTTFIINLPD